MQNSVPRSAKDTSMSLISSVAQDLVEMEFSKWRESVSIRKSRQDAASNRDANEVSRPSTREMLQRVSSLPIPPTVDELKQQRVNGTRLLGGSKPSGNGALLHEPMP